jgi:SAM-dependent methyltransferase
MATDKQFIPALSYDWLTPLYDPIIRRILPETELKQRLVEQAHIRSGQRVLDLGTGTATLAIMIKQRQPGAEVLGLDADPPMLERGRSKAALAGAAIRLDEGLATDLPYDDGTFDRVVSSLLFHHLPTADKRRTLREVWRVLRPGGELHVLDLGKPHNITSYLISQIERHLEEAEANIAGLLPAMMAEAGFSDAREAEHHPAMGITLSLYRARKPT